MRAGFTHLTMRTTDVPRSREFYSAVCGWTIDDDGRVRGFEASIVELPERARQGGAPSHWLGTLGVPDPDTMRDAWLQQGGRRLGPPHSPVVADPGGAVVALGAVGSCVPVGCLLHCADLDATLAAYRGTGWTPGPIRTADVGMRVVDLAPGMAAVESVGRSPAHPHWLFALPVDDLDAAAEEAVRWGATKHSEIPEQAQLGSRCLVFDDANGAALALFARD